MDGGYIRLYRKLTENPVWTQLSPAVLKIMLYFLLRANWRSSTWYDGRKQVLIPRGAFITSYASAAADCRLTLKQVRAAFNHLAKLEFASYVRDGSWTMVSVINYDDYQGENDTQNAPASGAQFRAQGSVILGQGEGTKQGTVEGIAAKPVSQADKEDRSGKPESRAQLRAGEVNEGGQTLGRARAHLRATDEEIKNIRINTCASDDARVGSFPHSTPRRKPYQDALEEIARNIHARHPNSAGAERRRDLDVAGVEKKLAAILKHKRVTASECEAYLRIIDGNHASCCDSETWRKDGGQFVKSLSGWLAPTEGRYEIKADSAVRPEPVRLLA